MSTHVRIALTRLIPACAALAVALSVAAPPLAASSARPGAEPSVSPQAQQQGQQAEPPETPAAPPAAVAGKWNVSLDMAMGTASVVFEFKQEGEKITGTYTGNYGTFPLEGTVKGRAIEFVVSTTIEGQASALWFGGEVAEDGATMKGPAELGGAGEAYWTAKRPE